MGFILKWSLLGFTLSIPVMQIVWRIAARQFSILYMVETTIEIVVSALFLLKIFLNIFLSPLTPTWRPVRFYIAPVIALTISIGVAAGNLLMFLFSENSLGRFLQALEIYILILFLMIVTFYNLPGARGQWRKSTATSFFGPEGTPQRLTFQLGAQDTKQPEKEQFAAQSTTLPVTREVQETTAPRQSILRISSWQQPSFVNRFSLRSNRTDLEQGSGLADSTSTRQQAQSDVAPSTTGSSSQKLPMQNIPVAQGSTADDSSSQKPPIMIAPEDIIEPQAQAQSTRPDTAGFSLSYYGGNRASDLSFPNPAFLTAESRNGSDSPVYGLDGIRRGGSARNSALSAGKGGNSLSSFDELLRQQTELDKSIAALRLFSPEADTSPAYDGSRAPTPRPALDRTTSAVTTSSGPVRVDSASARSEFSLSIFPEPPKSRVVSSAADTFLRMDSLEFPGSKDDLRIFLGSPSYLDANDRLNSSGTQYEITSFIGDLTSPSGKDSIQLGQQSGNEFERRRSNSLSTIRRLTAQPSAIPSSLIFSPPGTANPPITPQTQVGIRERANTQPTAAQLPPTILLPSSQRIPGLVPSGPRANQSRGRSNSGPSRPGVRLNISGPKPLGVSEKGGDLGPNAFERPRAAPPVVSETDRKPFDVL